MKHQKLLETTITVIDTESSHNTSLMIEEDRERLLAHVSTVNHSKECTSVKIIRTFSAYSNLKKIFNLPNDESQLLCLHGIRFLSLSWVVLGHSFVFILMFSGISIYQYSQ
jgi:hypothetical protein